MLVDIFTSTYNTTSSVGGIIIEKKKKQLLWKHQNLIFGIYPIISATVQGDLLASG